jgi:Fe-S cluster biogenesis protein NfuA
MTTKEQEKKIKEIIDKLRPFLINDGGNIEFVKYENGIVYIKMLGACANCHLIDYTLKDGIEAAIQEEVPEVTEVIDIGSIIKEDVF